MNKKIIAFVLINVLCLNFFSCGKPSSLYTVYVVNEADAKKDTHSSETVKYNDAEQIYTLPQNKESKKLGMIDKDLVLGNQTFQLQYQRTYNRYYVDYQLNRYSDEDNNIAASYRDDNGKLEYLRLDDDITYPISNSPITSESQLKEACNELVKQYVSDIEKYSISIKTKMWVYSEFGSGTETLDGFLSAGKHEKDEIRNYEVTYNYYIDDVITGDCVKVTVRRDGTLYILSLNMVGAYDKYASIDIDQTKCDTLIEEQTTAMCTVDNYSYTGSTNQKTLIVCDGVLCMLVTVTPTYEEEKSNQSLSVEPIEMLIPIAK